MALDAMRHRMNVTYTDGRNSPFDVHQAEILDRTSNLNRDL